MQDIIIYQPAIVKNFKLMFLNDSLFKNILGFYEGKQVEVLVREKKKKVSKATHAYYRGVLLPACMNSEVFGGWKIEEIHAYFASKHLKDIQEKEVYQSSMTSRSKVI